MDLVDVKSGELMESVDVVASRLGISETLLKQWAFWGEVPYLLFKGTAHFNFASVVMQVQVHRGASGIDGVMASRRRPVRSGEHKEVVCHPDEPITIPPIPGRRGAPRPTAKVTAAWRPTAAPSGGEGDWSHELSGLKSRWDCEALRKVYNTIRATGRRGLADFEGEQRLGILAQSYGPRRVELRDAGLVVAKQGDRRRTPLNKTATVWVAVAALNEASPSAADESAVEQLATD